MKKRTFTPIDNGQNYSVETSPIRSLSEEERSEYDLVHSLLSGGNIGLRFPDPLERQFLAFYQEVARSAFTQNSIYVMSLFLILGAIVFVLVPFHQLQNFLVGYAILTVVLMIFIAIGHVDSLNKYRDWYTGIATYIGVTTCLFMVASEEPGQMRILFEQATTVAIIVVYGLSKIRFYPACIVALLSGISYGAILRYGHYSFDWLTFQAYYVGANLVGMTIGFTLEYRERTVFLQKKLLKFDQTAIQKLNVELEKLSSEDALTHLANRRSFETFIGREWNRCMRKSLSISVVFVDVDYFKLYNDLYGHQLGDRCLVKIAQVLQSATERSTDMAARYGGEEFILLYSDVEPNDVLQNVERIKRKLENERILHGDSPVSEFVTVSVGVASTIPTAESGPSELIRQADQALYDAKNAGRNCWRAAKIG